MSCKPSSFHIVEKAAKEILISWNYPTISDDLKSIITQTCFSNGLEATGLFYYKRSGKLWIYTKQFIIDNDKPAAVVVTSQCYQPTLYQVICNLFAEKYSAGANGADLVKFYLNIYTKNGLCTDNDVPESFINLKQFPWRTDIKGLIRNHRTEVMLLYNALLIKKRILVYHSDVEQLQECLASISRLISIRKPEDTLQPLVQNIGEIKKNSSYYLVGTINRNILNQKNLFNIVVNLETQLSFREDDLEISSFHKEIGRLMIELSDSSASEADVISSISRKTLELFNYLDSLKKLGDGEIKLKDIESRKVSKRFAKFIVHLALAENILVI